MAEVGTVEEGMRAILRVACRRVRFAHPLFAALALTAIVPALLGCSASSPARQETPRIPTLTAIPDRTETGTVIASPEATVVDPTSVPVSAPPVTARCPDPNLTPVPSAQAPAATPDPDATPTPIRIRHPAAVPSLPAPTDATASPVPPAVTADPALEALIRARLGVDASHYAVVIEDLTDARGVAIDPDRVFYAASLFKLEVMYEVYDERAAGLLSFDEQFVASDYYSSFDLGPHLVAPCARESIGDLLHAMMSVSDNVAAVMLQDRAGAGNINDGMAALGLTQTRLTADGTLPATAGDMARLVGAIARMDAVSVAASSEMSDLMTTETINDRIPADLPAGTRVPHKTGNWHNATHDAGIVYGAKGTYVMVLMSDLGFGSNAASVEADIAKIAFDYFEQ
ncbi:MAG TPA: serine hydrolase [Dehalococcoidia bacterium]